MWRSFASGCAVVMLSATLVAQQGQAAKDPFAPKTPAKVNSAAKSQPAKAATQQSKPQANPASAKSTHPKPGHVAQDHALSPKMHADRAAAHTGSKQPETQTAAKPVAAQTKAEDQIGSNAGRRDPFLSPVQVLADQQNSVNCTGGKRCLIIGELELKGTVLMKDGRRMALVENLSHRPYTLNENDQLFNGTVTQITGDSVIFRETVKDRVGRESTKEVVKKVTAPSV